MNHWKETAEIVVRLAELGASGRRAALATVVRIEGSAYRRPGAKLLVEETGETLGGVSGGCLEADVREVAKEVLASGRSRMRHYDTRSDDDIVWGLGLGCNGIVDVFVQPATEGSLVALAEGIEQRLRGDRTFALATLVEGNADVGSVMLVDSDGIEGTLGTKARDPRAATLARAATPASGNGIYPVGDGSIFLERFTRPPHLVVCGAGDDAIPLVALAAEAGFRVTVIDHRSALLAPRRFPDAARLFEARPEDGKIELPAGDGALAVVKTHSLGHDREWTRRLLAAGFPFVGLLGPRLRTERILGEIGVADDGRVFGPVGLDIGADGSHQIAIAIVAELLAFLSHREPRHLRARHETIHVA